MKTIKFAVATALLLTSCTMTGKGQAANTLNGTLSGKIVDWPADIKGGEVRLYPWYSDYMAASSPIDAQGNFTLKLDDLKTTPDKLVKVSELFSKNSVVGEDCVGQGTAKYKEAHITHFRKNTETAPFPLLRTFSASRFARFL